MALPHLLIAYREQVAVQVLHIQVIRGKQEALVAVAL
jgi:hypothetical protein